MRDVERLRRDAANTYERGRLVMGLRVTAVVLPLALLCARESGEWRRCAAVSVMLLLVAVFARWRLPRGVRSVDAGLLSGALPMSCALVLCRFAWWWPDGAALGICAAAGFASGLFAGRVTVGTPQWTIAALVSGLTAALGCVGIGVGTAIGSTAAVAAGAVTVARLPSRVRI